MDFIARREAAIRQTHHKLRKELSPDRVVIHAWRILQKRPKALEHWLFAVLPHMDPNDAKKHVSKHGPEAHDPDSYGAHMDEQGWETLKLICKKRKIDFDALVNTTVPNLYALLGADSAAEVLEAAGGLAKLARMTQRDCRQLGSNAHLGGTKKCGMLEEHELATNERAVRILCSRTVLAARLDHFKGQYKGESLRQEVLYAQ